MSNLDLLIAAVISLAILSESDSGLSQTVKAEVNVWVESSRLEPVAVASLTIPPKELLISAAVKPAWPRVVAAPAISVAENLVLTATCFIAFVIEFSCSVEEPVIACKFFKLSSNWTAPPIVAAAAPTGIDNAP